MNSENAPALAPKIELKRKHSDATIQPLFGKKVKTVNATTLDPINIDIYRLRKEHDFEWDRIAEDINTRYNRGATTDRPLLSGAACYSRFSKYAAAIAQSRGEDYRREWYIADAHNKASLAVDSHALNKAIYWMYTKESKSWPEVARALNEKYRLDGTRGREPLSANICYQRFRNTGPSTARSVGEVFDKERYQWQQKRKTAGKPPATHSAPAATSRPKQPMIELPRIKTPKIKQEPANDLKNSAPVPRRRADSDVIVIASRPAVDRRKSIVADSTKSTTNSKLKTERPATDVAPKSASSTSKVAKNESVSRKMSAAYDADDLVKEAYSKVKARLWKDVSELVAFKSEGEVKMTDEECRSVMYGPRKSSL